MKILAYIKSNIGFIIFIVAMGVIMFSPGVKTAVLLGLMKTGLFNAKTEISATKSAPIMPSLKVLSLDGKSIDIANLKGKVVFLNFWTTWCPPCLAELPSIQALSEKLKTRKDIEFVMLDADGKLNASDAFMKRNGYSLPVYSASGAIPQTIFDGTLPTTIIVNKEGRIVMRHVGMADYNSKKMVDFMKSL